MKTKKSGKLSEKQFYFYGINFIVGFGFIATITGIIKHGLWGMLIFALTSFIAFSVILAFARGSQKYQDEVGGTYVYAKKASDNRFWVFFNGWNQFAQIPLFSATTILFLSQLLSEVDKSHQAIYQIGSLIFFISLTIIASFGLRLSKWFILVSAIIKWITVILGIILGIYLSFKTNYFAQNTSGFHQISISIITGSVLNFIYAFGGAEALAGIRTEVNTNRFKKVLMLIFATILIIYLSLYLLLLGLDQESLATSTSFLFFFKSTLSSAGIAIFIIGTLFNRISSTLSSNVYYARIIAPLALDGFIPSTFAKKNKYGEYRNALILSTFVSIVSMIIFTLIPLYLGIEDQFKFILDAGNIVFLMQYLLTIISILMIAYRRKEFKLPWWETTIYIISIALISFIIFSNLIPPIIGEKFTTKSLFLLPSYTSVILLGFIFWGVYTIVKKRKTTKSVAKN
ncbi:APC family permease [Mycoplasmopsis opalescens]|uniref:APC family permease n=1 Tax=Mycoplasmopsis opalescens TaxID=114886 RepID=UPI0004A76226|nr:APC family permease [Mycoplasmopsis opalescens]